MPGEQIRFFEKNKADFTNSVQIVTASQGDDFKDLALNRSNDSAWITTGSADSDNTTFTIDFVDLKSIDTFILVKHNFKDFIIDYFDGLSFINLVTVTSNTAVTTIHEFTAVTTTKIRLTITATQVTDDDKVLRQFIVTEAIGQLEGWPIIKRPEVSRNRKVSKLLSGKRSVRENVGGFGCQLQVRQWNIDADLTIVETLFDSNEGFLVWLSGGDEDQFAHKRQSYRLEDFFLMKCTNEYRPEWVKGIYPNGLRITMNLAEIA